MHRIALGVFLSLALVGSAEAKSRPQAPALTGERLYIAQMVGKERSEGRDRLTPARLARAITVIDIDHDGIDDYAVDYDAADHSSWCGTGGCDFELWRGTAHGHPVRVWNEMVREHKIVQRNGESVFDFDFHGSNCGTFGAEACPASFAWDAKAGRMIERPTPTGDTTVRLIDPLPLKAGQVPANIRAVSLAASKKCEAGGTSDEADLPVSIPDIDGDGVRDWSLTIAVCDKPGDFDLQQVLFATAGDAVRPVRAASGDRFSIAFGTKPATVARVNKTEACEVYSVEPEIKVCTRTPMVWNPTAKRLEIVGP